MTFIVIFLALLIERFFDWSHLRDWHWCTLYQRFITKHTLSFNPYLALFFILVPILLIVLLLEYLVDDWFYGFAKLVFDLLILLYSFGPKNLWADTFFSNNLLAIDDLQNASLKMVDAENTNFSTVDTSYTKSLRWYLLNNIFIAANVRVFAVIFWYVLLGPLGAVLYRMVALLSPGTSYAASEHAVADAARTVQSLLDWLPIRVFTFLFALCGHFVHVLEMWRKYVSFGLTNNETMLTECGIAALGFQDQEKVPEDGTAEKNAESLIDRVFMILIVLALVGVFLC